MSEGREEVLKSDDCFLCLKVRSTARWGETGVRELPEEQAVLSSHHNLVLTY